MMKKTIDQYTDKLIILWLFKQFQLDGIKNLDIDDYLEDGVTVQFFRQNGLTKESYDRYCVEICDDGLDEIDWQFIHG